MNKYKVTFHCSGGGKFETYVEGNNLESAMEHLTDHSLDEHKSLFQDSTRPNERAFVLNMSHVFYTEFDLVESSHFDTSSDKSFELFSFPQFIELEDRDIQTVIAHIHDDEVLAKALKMEDSEVGVKFYDNMTREQKLSVIVCDEQLGDVSLKESEECQTQICNIALQLAAENEIILK